MTVSGDILIVEDEPLLAFALHRFFQTYARCHVAPTAADARRLLADPRPWTGFIVDVKLTDGSGLDVLAEALLVAPSVPAVVLSGFLERETINRAAMLGAHVMCKPCETTELTWFLEQTRREPRRVAESAAERARLRWKLSPREVEILAAALKRVSRDDYLRDADMSVNTYKTHVRNMLAKTDYENLSSLVIDLLSDDA